MKHFAWNDLRDIVTVQGRTWEHEDNLYFNWSSSGFTVRFRGSALLAEFSAQSSEEYDGIPGDPNTPHRTVWPWISVFVDDNDQPCRTFELTNKSTKYLIYSGTDEQEHTVRVVKLTENIKTGLSLHSFDVDGEILMPVVEPIKKRIEFVGDSITCGFGLGTSEKDRFYYPQEENVWMAHGPTAARCLGMDWQMICISGICLAPRKEIPMPVAMNMLYEYTDRPAQQALELDADHWNFKEHPVDYVVINLGTNDATAASFSAAPKKIEEQYEKDYVHFLKTVRKCNGDKTKIICALGSMDYYFYDAMNRAVDCVTDLSGHKRMAIRVLQKLQHQLRADIGTFQAGASARFNRFVDNAHVDQLVRLIEGGADDLRQPYTLFIRRHPRSPPHRCRRSTASHGTS